jgi:hypothetical protein
MATGPNYPELVAEAERSVQGVKDPELRRIAFQKVLDELLSGGASSGSRSKRRTKKASKATTARKAAKSGTVTYIRELIEEDFFKKPKAITDVKVELENRGHHIPITSLSGPLQRLCKQKKLRRQRNEGRYVYSNW